MKKSRILSASLAAVFAASTLLVIAAPAQAEGLWANCQGQIWTNGLNRSAPHISCTTMGSTTKARGKLACTAAPDKATAWVRAYGSSTGGYCAFGASDYTYELAQA